MIPDKRVAEVVSRLTGVPVDCLTGHIISLLPDLNSADSLDRIELIMELEEEFGKEVVRWALRFMEALAQRHDVAHRSKPRTGPGPEGPDPLWDRDLDG
jgi:acyl carrier protein